MRVSQVSCDTKRMKLIEYLTEIPGLLNSSEINYSLCNVYH